MNNEKLISNIIFNEEAWPAIFGMTESEVLEIREAVYQWNEKEQAYKDWVQMYKGIHHESTFHIQLRSWLAAIRWMKSKQQTATI